MSSCGGNPHKIPKRNRVFPTKYSTYINLENQKYTILHIWFHLPLAFHRKLVFNPLMKDNGQTRIEKLREKYHSYAERVACGEEINGWKTDPAFAELVAKKKERTIVRNLKHI